jgi:hypothetical protein
MVSVTILTDDKPADVQELVWPRGSGHLDLRTHYCDAAPYPHVRPLITKDDLDGLEQFGVSGFGFRVQGFWFRVWI